MIEENTKTRKSGREWAELSLDDLRDAVRRVSFAASRDEKWRPVTVGIHVELQPHKAHVVATDGYRLAVARFIPIRPPRRKFAFTLPVADLRAALIHDGTRLIILSSDKHVILRSGAGEICCAPIEGAYPAWRRVIPAPGEPFWMVEIQELRAILRAVQPAMRHDHPSIRLTFHDGKLEVLGESRAEMAAEGTAEGSVLVNPRFLKDYLIAVKDCGSVRVQFPTGPYGASRWDASTHHIYLLMPIREEEKLRHGS